MKRYGVTIIWGILIWLMATMFFSFFGEEVLYSPGEKPFPLVTALLLLGTAGALWAAAYLYTLFDHAGDALIKFAVIGTAIGLALDTFSLANYRFVFPALSETQMISFSVWMSCAYAIYLAVPCAMHRYKNSKYSR